MQLQTKLEKYEVSLQTALHSDQVEIVGLNLCPSETPEVSYCGLVSVRATFNKKFTDNIFVAVIFGKIILL